MKRNVKTIAILLTVLMLAMVGCSPKATSTPKTEPTAEPVTKAEVTAVPEAAPEAKPIKVGIVLAGVINDLSWNQALYEGAVRLKEAGVIDFNYTERVTPADAERIFRRYAEQGYDLVFGHSATYKDNIFKVAEEFPNVNFAYSASGDKSTLDNLAAFNQPHHEPAYLIGMIAGGMTKSNQLAFVGGIATPGAKALFKAFELGAKEVNPDVTVEAVYTGSFDDIAKGKATAATLADRGVDYFIANGDGPARGSIEAAREKGVYATGFMMDMSPLAPEAVLTSMWWDGEKALRQAVDDIIAGTFRPAKYYHGGTVGGVYVPFINPALAEKVPAEVMEKMQAKLAEIESGAFEVPFIVD